MLPPNLKSVAPLRHLRVAFKPTGAAMVGLLLRYVYLHF